MTSYVAKLVAKKVLGETAKNKFGGEDPYFENVPATRLDGKPGRVRKKRKAVPPGLSEHDAQVLTKVKRRAYRLDCKFSLCGFKFGYGSLIGFIPAIGDVLDLLLALMVVKTCCSVEGGLPMSVKLQMYLAILADFAVGLVPIIGDIGDAAYRVNTKNAARLEAFLREKGQKALRQSGVMVPEVDPSDPSEFERFQQQGPSEYEADPDGNVVSKGKITKTAPSAPKEQSAGGRFLGFGRRDPPNDVEMATATSQSQQSRR